VARDVHLLPHQLKAKLAVAIRDIEFTTHTYNILAREGIIYVGDLIEWPETELLRLWGFGKKSLSEIKAFLGSELRLGMELDGWSHQTAEEFKTIVNGEGQETLDGDARNSWCEPLDRPRDLHSEPEDVKVRLARRISDVDFSPRTQHALAAAQLVFVGDLVETPAAELLRLPNFGRKSLNEVQNFLAPDLSLGTSFEGWTRDTAAELERRFQKRLEAARLSEFISKMERTGPIESLEDELRAVADIGYSDRRSASIALSYYGWDGSGTQTLEAVGQRFGLTRERVRQISAKLSERFEDRHLELPWLNKARGKIARLVPAVSSEVEQALLDERITREPFCLSGVFSALGIISGTTPFTAVTLNGVELITPASHLDPARRIMQIARRTAHRNCCCNVNDVAEEVSKEQNFNCSPEFVLAVVRTDPDYRSLDDEWFWLISRPSRLLNQLNKIFAVAPRVRLGELRAALSRDYRTAGFSPPRRVLASLVDQLPNFRVEDDLATAMSPPTPAEVLSDLELRFYEVFVEEGPVLARDTLERALLGAGVNYASFYQYLSYCPIITRVGIGIYALVGAPISPGLVGDLAMRQIPKKTFLGSGWCRGGEIWLAYELTYSNIGSGSFGIPSAIKDLLQGAYALRSEDGGDFGSATGRDTSLYGFGKFFRRRGAEPGERLVFVVNLKSKTITARIGDAALVELYERRETSPDSDQSLESEPEFDECDSLS